MPSWKELKRFCERDDWELYKSTDHDFYRKIDENGNVSFENAKLMKEAGANIFVAGTSSVFKSGLTLEEGISDLRNATK